MFLISYMPNLVIISIVLAVVIGFIIFLIWKNNRDKNSENPGAQDAVNSTIKEQELRKDKL